MPMYRYTVRYDAGFHTEFFEGEISASSYEEAETIAEENAAIWDGTVCEIEEFTDGGHNG